MDIPTAQQSLDEAINAALIADSSNQMAQAQVATARQALADAQTALASQIADGKARAVSIIDNALLAERVAGKLAAIKYIQMNSGCTQADAVAAWAQFAMTGRPADRQWLLQDGNGLLQEFIANAVAAGYIPDGSWATFTAFIAATPLGVLMED